MRHFFLTLLSLLALATALATPGDPKLFGVTSQGGSYLHGTIYSINMDGSGFTNLHNFDSINGKHPHGPLVQLPNGRLVGITAHGGRAGKGVLYSINADGSGFAVLKHFLEGRPSIGMLLASDGKLYGTTAVSKVNRGVAFRINTDGTGYTEIANFSPFYSFDTDQEDIAFPLIELSDGTLVGTMFYSQDGRGEVYRMAKDGSGARILHAFQFDEGANPRSIMQASDGNLYVTTSSGGDPIATPGGYGSVVSMTPDGTNVTEIFSWSDTPGALGKYPNWGLAEGPDGKLYGTTDGYGAMSTGLVFKINKDGTGYTPIYLGDWDSGASALHGVTFSPGGRLFVAFSFGGDFQYGTIVAMDQDGGNPSVLNHFDETSGMIPGMGALLFGVEASPTIDPPCCQLTGTVFNTVDGFSLTHGLAKLFHADGGLVRSSDVNGGFFSMDTLERGQYILQILPLGAENENVFSTYYPFTQFHAEAIVIEMDANATIGMGVMGNEPLASAQGTGIITGRVLVVGATGGKLIGGRTMTGTGAPLVPVYLLDPKDDNILNRALTDADGNFTFQSVATGQYRFSLDVVGTALVETSAPIAFDEATTVQMNVTATISGTGIITIDLSIDMITSLETKTLHRIAVYPNPVSERLTITSDKENLQGWKIISPDGREIGNLKTEVVGNRSIVDVTNLQSGLYILIVRSTSCTSAIKFIKQDR